MAGIPGILVALVPSGAQVMTVSGAFSPESPAPGSAPQPDSSDAMAAAHAVAEAIGTTRARGKGRGRRRRRAVMTPQPSVLPGTGE
ncbi:hypothetical protein [Streptomyces kronopolitis]|nr:hypothetical protein Stsp01_32330 [Streptomyces sp. NBRC 13847]